MKDSIEELIHTYSGRVRYLDQLNKEANDNLSKIRIGAKKSVYEEVIKDLKQMLEDAKDTA
jgi:RNA-binding protein YhbY